MEKKEESMNGTADSVAVTISEKGFSRQSKFFPSEDADSKLRGRCNTHMKVDISRKLFDSINRRRIEEPKRLKASAASASCSIHRVPLTIRENNEKPYTPRLVSIGPFHRGKGEHMQIMEEHKWRYLNAVVERIGEDCLERFFIAVRLLEKRARDCYSEEIDLDSDSFVEMMILDGLFLIELFRRAFLQEDANDPIINFQWVSYLLRAELLMLENQMPFFILQHLFDLMNLSCPSLTEITVNFFSASVESMNFAKASDPKFHPQHVLHLIHFCLLPLGRNENLRKFCVKGTPSACVLKEAGVKFKQRNNTDSILDIKFHEGVINMPTLRITDETAPLFHNLIALEQCYGHCNHFFTSYCSFLDWLINSEKDVSILCREQVIENWLGSDQEVADFINKISHNITLHIDDCHLVDVLNDIDEYYRSTWHVWRANLMHNYFNSPWAIISIVAAVILLLLTVTQTVLTAFPNFAHGK